MQLAPILSLLDAIWYPIGGVIVGILIHIFIEWRSEFYSRMNLRRALIAELKAAESVVDQDTSQIVDIPSIIESIPRSIYDANANRIGELSKDEVTYITAFYSELKIYQSQGEGMAELMRDVDEMMGILKDLEEFIGAISENPEMVDEIIERYEWMRRSEADGHFPGRKYIRDLEKRRTNALNELESNLESTFYRTIYSNFLDELHTIGKVLRTPDTLEEMPVNQRMTLVAIGQLFQFDPFTRQDLRGAIAEENTSDIFTNNKEIDSGTIILEILVMKRLLEKVDRDRYKLKMQECAQLLHDYHQTSDEIRTDEADMGWIP